MNEVNKKSKELESRLILKCAQTVIGPQQEHSIKQSFNESLDWDYVLTIAGRNGLLPLVSWNLLQKFRPEIPDSVAEKLERFFQTHAQNNLFLTLKLIEAIKLLEKNDIPALPFKGTVLASRAYGNLSLRQYCDLDILVQPKCFDEAAKVLSENGYVAIDETSWLKRKTLFFTHIKDIRLISPDKRVQIELHWKLSGSHFSLPLEISQLWDRLLKIEMGGAEVYDLPFNDLFVYLCLHGSRHEWERLSWIADLRELIRATEKKGEKINWEEVSQHAKRYGCERVVELGLFLIQKFFGDKPDYPNFESIENNQAYHKISCQVEERIFSETPMHSLKYDKYMYLLSLQENRADRMKLYLVYFTFYLKLAFRPNALDKEIFHLPSVLSPLYYVLRPLRLVYTYFNRESVKKVALKK